MTRDRDRKHDRGHPRTLAEASDPSIPHAAETPERKATCGACGSERIVTSFMRRNRDSQFSARPGEATDAFYCGCQNDEPEMDGLDPGWGGSDL